MSTRTFFAPITSIDKLRVVVGSNDAQLEKKLQDDLNKQAKKDYGTIVLEEMDDWDRDEYEEACAAIKNIISGKSKKEPGCWLYILTKIAEQQKLFLKFKIPFTNSDWKHVWIWEEYIDHVSELAGKPATKLLRYLELGRPLKGKNVEFDGCTFAWLTQVEMQLLHQSLDRIDVADDLFEFHDQLIGTFALCCKKKCDLFMGAS